MENLRILGKTNVDKFSSSITKEDIKKFASKYRNMEIFKDQDDEYIFWFLALFILFENENYIAQNQWNSFANEVKTMNRFFPNNELLNKIKNISCKTILNI